jgi:hypothetical protein
MCYPVLPETLPLASVVFAPVMFPPVKFPAIVALSVVCATTDVTSADPVVARVVAPARMAMIANIVIVFNVIDKRDHHYIR